MTEQVTGHYTQLAWGKTYEIGCGFMVTKGNQKHHIHDKHHRHNEGRVGGRFEYVSEIEISVE